MPSPRSYAVGVALAAVATVAVPATASAASPFSCRASAARVSVLNIGPIEPFVANRPDSPCVSDEATLLGTRTIGPLTVAAVDAKTTTTPPGPGPFAPGQGVRSNASVADAAIGLGGLAISLHVLSSQATFTCVAGSRVPVRSGNSSVASVTINGRTTFVGNTPLDIPLGPLGVLHLNQQVQTGNPDVLIQRAVYLDSPLAQVVIAESRVDKQPGLICQ